MLRTRPVIYQNLQKQENQESAEKTKHNNTQTETRKEKQQQPNKKQLDATRNTRI